jgi:predicted nucleotidyltransferase
VRDWPERRSAERLRLWPTLAELVMRIEARTELFDGAILIGSLVEGKGDELSDIDIVSVVRDGRFAQAWATRAELSAGALYSWDHVEGEDREVKGHKWLTRDLVEVECLIATPASGMHLAEPVAVLAGEPSLPERFSRSGPLPRAAVDSYAQERRERSEMHEVEARYGELMRTLRRLLR